MAGLLAGIAGVAASEAVAALLTNVSSPLLAIGNRAVDAAPRPVKEWAIETFGTADKPVLIGGVIGAVAVAAVILGIVGVRHLRVALAAFLVLCAVVTAAAVTDRVSTASPLTNLLPVLALVAVGLVALLALLRPLQVTPAHPLADSPSAASHNSPTTATTATTPAITMEESVTDGKPRLLARDASASAAPTGASSRGSQTASHTSSRTSSAHLPGDELPAAFDRRAFLKAVAAVSAVAAAGGAIASSYGGPAAAASRAGVTLPRPASPAPRLASGTSLDVPGITPHVTSNADFYRVDTALRVPDVPVGSWSLRIHGDVDKELTLSFDDLLSRRLVERRITLTCVSNPVGGPYVGNATWIGVPLRDLLQEAGVKAGADAVKSTSADGFTAGTPLSALTDPNRDALLAVAMNGEPLPLDHGFPVRMVTPGLYGYVSATKWLVDLEVTRFADFKAYWTTRGYSAEAPIKTAARIDVPRSFAQVAPGKVQVAGVAWSQNRGIAGVEVRVDQGAWSRATLAEQDNIDTWRQWLWEWEAPAGRHLIEVRATDETGFTQTPRRAPIAPDGATGWHSVAVTVE